MKQRSLEQRAFLAAQTGPLRDAVYDLEKEQVVHSGFIFKLENHMGDAWTKKPDPNHVAFF